MTGLDRLRAATVGAQKKFPSRTVVLVADPDFGSRAALLECEHELDADGKPLLDEDGRPKKVLDEFRLLVPKRGEDGNPVVAEVDRELPRFFIEVRAPSVAVREEILAASRVKRGKEMDLDTAKLHVECCIRLAHDPDTGSRIYGIEDRKILTEQPAGGFVTAIGQVAQALVFPEIGAVGKALARAQIASSRASSPASEA